MLSTRTLFVTALAVLAAGASLSAGPVDFEITDASLSSTAGDTLVLNTNTAPLFHNGNNLFSLDDGDSDTLPLFYVWVGNLGSVTSIPNSFDGEAVTATIDFSLPGDGSASVGGSAVVDHSVVLHGAIDYGQLVWNDPTIVTLGGDTFSIGLSNVTFNLGGFGYLVDGPVLAGREEATITQLSAVPDNWNTAALLGIAAFAVGLSRRRLRRLRRAARAAHP